LPYPFSGSRSEWEERQILLHLHGRYRLPLQSTLGMPVQFGLGCATEDSRIARNTHYQTPRGYAWAIRALEGVKKSLESKRSHAKSPRVAKQTKAFLPEGPFARLRASFRALVPLLSHESVDSFIISWQGMAPGAVFGWQLAASVAKKLNATGAHHMTGTFGGCLVSTTRRFSSGYASGETELGRHSY